MSGKKRINMEVIRRFDPFTGDPSPTAEDFQEFAEKLTKLLESTSDGAKKKKMSYSISPAAQELIKNLSEESGVTQGSIIDLAPFFFGALIEKSLKRRSERLPILEESIRQILGIVSGVALNAPHLTCYLDRISAMVTDLLEMEKEAVTAKNYQGVSPESWPSLSDTEKGQELPAYFREIEEMLEPDSQLESIFKVMFKKE